MGSLHVPAYTSRHNALLEAHSVLEEVRDLLQQNQPAAALQRLLEEVGDASEQAEEEELDDDPEVLGQQLLESVQLLAPPLQPFSGRCFWLDM